MKAGKKGYNHEGRCKVEGHARKGGASRGRVSKTGRGKVLDRMIENIWF